MDPEDLAVAWTRAADALAAAGRHDEAVALYDRAIAACPEACEAWTGKGSVLRLQGRLVEALSCLEGALEIAPSPVAEDLRDRVLEALEHDPRPR